MLVRQYLKTALQLGKKSNAKMLSSKPQVFVTRPDIPDAAIAELKKRCDIECWSQICPCPREALLKGVKGKDAIYCLITEKIDSELLDAAGSNLKVVGTMSVGFEHIDLMECRKRNVLVGNTPNVLTDATADIGLALLLATSRRMFEARLQMENGGWENSSWGPLWMCGPSIKGSTVGIVGLGRIGQAVAERLKPLKVAKIYYSGNKEKPEGSALGAEFTSLENLLSKSDFVIVCCSLNPQTVKLFDGKAFALMKNTAIFINISRGGIVDQEALCHALSTNQIYAAGLDVMTPEPLPRDHPLLGMANCTLVPHIGSATVETRTEMAMLTTANILAGLDQRPLPCPL